MKPEHAIQNMALFCDFENVALGVRDAKYAAFDIQKVLERLLLKGNIVVKKAYCDWNRFREFKAGMHEAAFELIDIPHLRMSGKNSADIRMVVDALDLCYTKAHVDTFVIISGDSDFSPLVSKLRENNKVVIGVGVKNSTADLLTSNCDEFIYYDDLVRASEKQAKSKAKAKARPAPRSAPRKPKAGEDKAGDDKAGEDRGAPDKAGDDEDREERRLEGLDLVLDTIEDLFHERGEEEKVWGSMVKQTLKRRRPGFNEAFHGYRTFTELLEDARDRGMLDMEYDGKSGGYIITDVFEVE
ncbi:MAG: NYN domain-containing protein [Hyphomicrobiales bacterium]|nr:NYN domain-containing protein [Hyphomicrobiales bacterium]